MKEFFSNIWGKLAELYAMYSDFVHSILPRELGDLAVWVINIAVVSLIVVGLAKMAFRSREE